MYYVINWPLYSVNTLFPITYWLWGGGKIRVRPEDRCAFNDVFVCRHYDAPIPWEKVRSVVDVGANIGAFSVFAHQQAPHAQITAMEPDGGNYRELVRNAPFATCIQAAVDGEEGEGFLYTGKGAGMHSLYGEGEKQVVRKITLHSFLPCDLLKFDCEGAEFAILRSLSAEEWKGISYMLVELHRVSGEDGAALRSTIEHAGFRVIDQAKHVIYCERVS